MTIAKKAAQGVAWNLATGLGSRVVQLAGTLLLARLLAPEQFGEVAVASVCVTTAGQLASFSFGQYLIAKRSPASVAFQAAVLHVALGVVALAAVILLAEPLGAFLNAPGMVRYVPGFAAAQMLDRVGNIPGRLLVRDLRFRTVAIANAAGELTYTVTAVALAFGPHWGGDALVAGVVARSALKAVVFLVAAPRAEWLVPCPLQRETVRDLMSYCTPILLGSLAELASTRWDNLVVAWLFGPVVMGRYSLAFSLADTPVSYVAEHIGDVLMPSYARMEQARRRAATERAAALMALIVAPLGVGLGAVAPTLVGTFFDARWAGIEWMIAILSVMTVFRPMSWSAGALMQAQQRNTVIMALTFMKTPLLLGLVASLGWLGGPLWACVGSGATHAITMVVTVHLTARLEGIGFKSYMLGVGRPLAACVPMFGAVMALKALAAGSGVSAPFLLVAEVLLGAAVYLPAAYLLATPTARDLVALVREAAGRRSTATQPPPPAPVP